MSNLHEYAKEELDRIDDGTEEQAEINKDVMDIVDKFSQQGHSGFSASYALSIITRLLAFYPLTPLTGATGEWQYVASDGKRNTGNLYQNTRYSALFKDDTGCWDIDRIIVSYEGDPDNTFYGPKYYVKFPYKPAVNKHYYIVLPKVFAREGVPNPSQKDYVAFTNDEELKKHILNQLD